MALNYTYPHFNTYHKKKERTLLGLNITINGMTITLFTHSFLR